MPPRTIQRALGLALAGLLLGGPAPGLAPAQPPRVDGDGNPLPGGALARLGSINLRDGGQVMGLTFSPDGKLLASAGAVGTVSLWDVATGKARHVVQTHPWGINGIRFSQDGRFLHVWASSGADIYVDVATGRAVPPPRGERAAPNRDPNRARPRSVQSADGQVRITREGDEKELRVCNAQTGKELRRLTGLPWPAEHLALTADGRTAAAAGFSERQLLLWDVATGKPLHPSTGHRSLVGSLHLAPDGKTLFTGGDDQTLRVWDLATRRQLRQFDRPHRRSAVSPDGKQFALFTREGNLGLVDAESGKRLREFAHVPGAGGSMTFSPDGRALFLATHDRGVRRWDVASGQEGRTLPIKELGIFAMAASPAGRYLACGGQHRLLHVWDLDADAPRYRFPLQSTTMSVAFSADGRLLTSGGQKPVRVWEAASGKEVLVLDGHAKYSLTVAFSPCGRLLATAGADHTLLLWDLATGKALTRLDGHRGNVYSLVFAHDGRTLFSGGMDTSVLVWDLTAPPWLAALPARALSPKDLEKRWADLGGDAAAAYRAVWDLVRSPKESVPFLRDSLVAARAPAPDEKVARLIRDLDDARFQVREQASAALRRLGAAAAREMRAALQGNPSAEVGARLKAILSELPDMGVTGPPTEVLRASRAIHALEQTGTAEAQGALRVVSTRAAGGARAEATAALRRLMGRATAPGHGSKKQ